uniref:Uncharacterized protein n=1 Tax=Anguilla anguilla TaxID=7936 RepID=A0A0E9U7Z2_ANGAN
MFILAVDRSILNYGEQHGKLTV